ncbi:BSD [Macleaya cordata]|uniref:BSD n=1 Tax=Macleaya cordata TaxID=56857 RepID=A0A200PNQ2_MACCD|nr:BSD [Macleaya cordata]
MSWLSSLSNPFKSESEHDEQEEEEEDLSEEEEQESPSHGGQGVKENLSEIGKSISRQLWGVASFLAPPPVSTTTTTTDSTSDSTTDSSSQTLVGIRNDFAEISGSFKSGLSLLSTTKAVNEISRLATNLLQFPKEDDDEEDELPEGIVGVNEEILEFVRVMSSRPECWTDFPLSLDKNDFDMSNAQKEHSSTMEQLTPSLADLRLELCPSFMSEGRFWMTYFILLHPRLNESDSMLLSTPQIVEARDVLLQNLKHKTDTALQSSTSKADDVGVSNKVSNIGEENNAVQQKEVLAETVNPTRQENVDEQENIDQWLEEEDAEPGTSSDSRKQLGNDEDVSFSDLEDDDNDDASTTPARSSQVQNAQGSSYHGSNEWVQLSENSDNGATRKTAVQPTSREKDSEGEESNDWLTIDDFDADSVGNA